MKNNIWVPVYEFPDHLINQHGCVKDSFGKVRPIWRNGKNRLHSAVTLWEGKHRKSRGILKLLLQSFIGPKKECHPAFKTTSKRIHLDNIEWRNTSQFRKEHVRNGENCPRHKLLKEQVMQILHNKKSAKYNAQKYGVSTSLIFQIRRKETWRRLYEK